MKTITTTSERKERLGRWVTRTGMAIFLLGVPALIGALNTHGGTADWWAITAMLAGGLGALTAGLGRLFGRAARARRRALKQVDRGIAAMVRAALPTDAPLTEETVLPLLERDDAHVRLAAISALAALGSNVSCERLRGVATSDADHSVRTLAVDTLVHLRERGLTRQLGESPAEGGLSRLDVGGDGHLSETVDAAAVSFA